MQEKLVILVPCFNEEKNVRATINSINNALPKIDLAVKIILIDDGSTDNTLKEIQNICHDYDYCEMLINKKNIGLGRSVLDAYKIIDDDAWVTVVPGDNEFVFESILNHLSIRSDYDLILGYLQNTVIRTLMRRMASNTFTKLAQFLYDFPYRYLNGLKLYRVDIFKGINVVSRGHAFNAELIAKAQLKNPNLKIAEVPFLARGRSKGDSKAFKLAAIYKAIKELIVGYRSVCHYRDEVITKGNIILIL